MVGRIAAFALVWALLSVSLSVNAQETGTSYFQNLGLSSFGEASPSLITQEPAAVLVFSGGAGSADATALFNTWVNKTTRNFRGAAFGVAYKPAGQPKEILEEVLSQRDLQFPVFLTETDLLAGRDYRLMVVSGGRAYDVPGLDFAALDAELAKHAGAAEATATAAAAPVTAPAAPAATPVAPATTPVAPPVDVAAAAPPPVATPATDPAVTPGTTVAATVGTGLYYNTRYGFTVEFPRGWTYRVARNNDGAVGRAPAGRNVDLRTWAVPSTQMSDGSAGQMSVPEYIDEHLKLISEQTGTRVDILQRFRVDDEGVRGFDYTYSFSRPVEVPGAAAPEARPPLVRHRGRIQVFETDGVFKVVSAEAPTAEFERSGPVIEEFIQTFHPFIADEQGNPVAAPPAAAAPIQPGGQPDPGPGARPVVEP